MEKNLVDLKNVVNEVKSIINEIGSELKSKADSITNIIPIININYLNFIEHINTWYIIVEHDNYEQFNAFIPSETIRLTIANFICIKDAFISFKNNSFNYQILGQFASKFEASKSYIINFLPHVKGNLNEAIKKITHFTKEKELIDDYINKTKILAQDLETKQKTIQSFYDAFLTNNSSNTEDKRGMKSFIEDSYKTIKQKYDELFVVKQELKVNDNKVPVDGNIGKMDYFIQDICNNQSKISTLTSEIEKQKNEIGVIKSDFKNELDGNDKLSIVGLKKTIEEYKEKMRLQQSEIDKMKDKTKKALGNDIERIMVETFKDEAFYKSIESWVMVLMSLGCLLGIGIIGYKWLSSLTNLQNGIDWTVLIFRLSIFIPLGFGFWFCNKRHDMLSLLAAEYRYKRSIIEAMIGYRARYETSSDQFKESFIKEYAVFFNKTFDEINKNPAEKINKVLMNNKFSVKELESFLEKINPIKK